VADDYREASPSARFPAFISARADSHVSKFSGTGLAAFVGVSHYASD
jgi:hypothetical protein